MNPLKSSGGYSIKKGLYVEPDAETIGGNESNGRKKANPLSFGDRSSLGIKFNVGKGHGEENASS